MPPPTSDKASLRARRCALHAAAFLTRAGVLNPAQFQPSRRKRQYQHSIRLGVPFVRLTSMSNFPRNIDATQASSVPVHNVALAYPMIVHRQALHPVCVDPVTLRIRQTLQQARKGGFASVSHFKVLLPIAHRVFQRAAQDPAPIAFIAASNAHIRPLRFQRHHRLKGFFTHE